MGESLEIEGKKNPPRSNPGVRYSGKRVGRAGLRGYLPGRVPSDHEHQIHPVSQLTGQTPGLLPRPANPGLLGVRPRNQYFNKHSKTLTFFYILILENHWFRFYYLLSRNLGAWMINENNNPIVFQNFED